jgi:hypothetical protein
MMEQGRAVRPSASGGVLDQLARSRRWPPRLRTSTGASIPLARKYRRMASRTWSEADVLSVLASASKASRASGVSTTSSFVRSSAATFDPLRMSDIQVTLILALGVSASISDIDNVPQQVTVRQLTPSTRNANDPLVTGRCVGFKVVGRTFQSWPSVLVTLATTIPGGCRLHP